MPHSSRPCSYDARFRKALWPARVLLALAAYSASTRFSGAVGPKDEACCGIAASHTSSLKEVQNRNKRLRAQLSQFRWPVLTCFISDGQIYSLPLRAQRQDLPHAPTEARLAYLAGFFDGDGCVGCETRLTGACLKVTQSFDQAEVLLLFREAFGGSVTCERGGVGLRKPTLHWQSYGQTARRAAGLMALHSITKQKQLLLAAQWPNSKSRQRENLKAELRALKEHDSGVAGPCSWEYCAGFFDAEGCISQQYGGASLVLHIGQKHPQVLKCLRQFFATTLGIDVAIRKSGEYMHALRVCNVHSCKRILQRMLDAGLLCKAKQAELALDLTPQNAGQVSRELGRLTGNQNFGKRLDAAGLERARRIKGARGQAARLKRQGQLAEAEAKLLEVNALKQEHDLLKAILENQQLLEYMCKVQSLHATSWAGPHARGM